MEQFRGIFRLTYAGDAHIVLRTKVQVCAVPCSLVIPSFFRFNCIFLSMPSYTHLRGELLCIRYHRGLFLLSCQGDPWSGITFVWYFFA